MADFIIAVADLFEAEGRALRDATIRLRWGLAMITLASFFVAVGGALCLWAIFQYLSRAVDTATAALLTGGITLLLAVALVWLVRRLNR